jgi:hypothetical protein
MTNPTFTLTSPAFTHGARVPARHTCEGDDLSPPLQWSQVPEETRSFALIVDDPDAPSGTFTHWVRFDIPADARELPEGDANLGIEGHNDFHQTGYGGPCPPPKHGDHRYQFRLLALDAPSLDLARGAARADVEASLEGHVLAEAVLVGRYQRG